MRRGFVHVQVRGKYVQTRISFLKIGYKFGKDFHGQIPGLRCRAHIVFIANLKYDLMEQFLLFPGPNFFVVIINLPVAPSLLVVVPSDGVIKEFMIDFLYRFIAITMIQMTALRVCILCVKASAVVIDGTFPDHHADSPFQMSPLLLKSVSFPAKPVLLLLSKVTQKRF
jgi:hypothetical protein